MRFIMIMFPGGYENAKPGTLPDLKDCERMGKYKEQVAKVGVLLSVDGVRPPSTGARVTYKGGKAKVTDCPLPSPRKSPAISGLFRRGRGTPAVLGDLF